MKLLLDTHLLIWAADSIDRIPAAARLLMADPDNELLFSVASLWEIAIKSSQKRNDFTVDARAFRRALLDNEYVELPVLGIHAVAVNSLPAIHRDPFDRMLIAQAMIEGITLLTHDSTLAAYAGPVHLI